MTTIPFLQARHFKAASRTKVDLVVIHSAEIGEALDGAEILMQRCTERRVGPDGQEIISSWHYAVDADSVTQSVKEVDVAFHAPGANANGIGIELTGRARQTAAEWDDQFSRATVARAAGLTAEICRRWGIPATFIDAVGLRAGARGITTHAQVSLAFGKSTHNDPGAFFPLNSFIEQVRRASSLTS